MAWALGWNRVLLSAGLFGFNGAMVGLAWPVLFPPSSPGFLLVVPAALAATWLQARMLPAFSLRDLPVLALPFVLVVWAVQGLVALFGGAQTTIVPPRVVGPWAGSSGVALLTITRELIVPAIPGVVAIAIGLWIASRVTLSLALSGLLLGVVAALALGGPAGGYWVGGYAYTAAPLALGVGVFFPLTRRSLALAFVLATAGVVIWVLTAHALAPVGLLPLTVVANVLLLAALAVTRSERVGRVLGVRPLALADAGPPRRAGGEGSEAPRDEEIEQLVGLLRRSERIVVLSGAGMSTESGIPDYRSQLGFWFDANAEELVYSRFLSSAASRRLYWRLHRRFLSLLRSARPNPGHLMLAELHRHGTLLGIATQNVDELHQAAGVPGDRIVELHGTARQILCLRCGDRSGTAAVPAWRRLPTSCPRCGGLLKVDTVSFGEPLDPGRLERAAAWCRSADLLLILGTSLQVAPAASLPDLARVRGVPTVVINRTPTPLDAWATLVVRGLTAGVLGEARRRLMGVPPPRVIRPMHRVDFHGLCRVVDEWWSDSVRYLLHPLYLEHFPQTCLVAEENGLLAGFLIGFRSQARADEAYVHLVGTAPGFRGRGIGRALYERFFSVVRERGCTRVTAITVPGNSGSLAFHERLGFRLRQDGAAWTGSVPFFPDYAGPGVDCVLMERDLDSEGGFAPLPTPPPSEVAAARAAARTR